MNLELVGESSTPLLFDETTRARIREIIEAGTADNTRRAYASDLRYFWTWAACRGHRTAYPVSVEILLQFISDHVPELPGNIEAAMVEFGAKRPGPHKVSTLCRRLACISSVHQKRGLPNPCLAEPIKELIKSARRRSSRMGEEPSCKKALTGDLLHGLLETCDTQSPIGMRDRALLLFAFSSGGRRRSEVAAAEIKHLNELGRDYVYTLRRSKTDQEGKGHTVPVKGIAADALRSWLELVGDREGRIFRRISRAGAILPEGLSDSWVAKIVKRRAMLAGLDANEFAGHSLRSGFVTEAGRQGVAIQDVMQLTGHRSFDIAMIYYKRGNVLKNRAADLI